MLTKFHKNTTKMSSIKLDVQWSPVHANKFITWGTEICLYEVMQIKENNKQLCK